MCSGFTHHYYTYIGDKSRSCGTTTVNQINVDTTRSGSKQKHVTLTNAANMYATTSSNCYAHLPKLMCFDPAELAESEPAVFHLPSSSSSGSPN